MTQTSNRLFDEMARLMNDAAGVAQGVRREFDTLFRAQAERILRELDVVQREEFEAVKEMARLAREENEELKERIEALEARLGERRCLPRNRRRGRRGRRPRARRKRAASRHQGPQRRSAVVSDHFAQANPIYVQNRSTAAATAPSETRPTDFTTRPALRVTIRSVQIQLGAGGFRPRDRPQ